MTTDNQLAPTDAEIDAIWALLARAAIASPTKFAREVLARWGAQPTPSSAAEFALQALVAAGHVSQELVDRALALPGAPTPATRKPLTDEQAISLCKMGPVHAPDGQVVRTPEKYRRELEDAKFAGIRKAERAHGIT